MKDKKIKKFIHSLGLKNNVVDEEVLKIVSSPFAFTAKEIEKLNKEGLTRSNKKEYTQKIFHYKRIGKLYLNNNYGRKD
jgi:hypothetical protein